MTEINFVDGTALTPSSFGETSLTTGSWIPKKYTGSYGTNGFKLNFSDTSAATAAAIGKDSSGNGNNWTPSGISVTAGVTYDAMLDVPTNTSATVANYAIVNPLDIAGTPTISDGNLKLTNGSAAWGGSRTGFAMTSGKWYWEITILSANTAANGICLGIANSSTQTAGINVANQWIYNNNSGGGRKALNGTISAYGVTYVANDIVGIAFDADAGSITCYVNNSSQGVMASSGLPNPAFPYTQTYSSDSVAVNFGQRPFSYTPPSGFVALNTYNLPTPTILQGNLYMDATLYTQNGAASNVVVNAGQFKPDLVWIKGRSNATWNNLVDSVRGGSKTVYSNSTSAEGTDNYINTFNSNGFTLNIGDTGSNSTSGRTMVAWNWQAGQGSSSSNTSGSITSTVSVNATAGFSVVTYTGTGANATVGHGLGVAPKMIIVKNRSIVQNWLVYHTSLTSASYYLVLNSTVAQDGPYTTLWNGTAPTSTVFSIGTDSAVSGNGNSLVAYCWAEIAGFSKFGSYTGNGSADGTFVYTGFRPKFIMTKSSSNISNWAIVDTSRDTYNLAGLGLQANTSDAEFTPASSGFPVDILSNGFKQRATSQPNTSGYTYIYMAFAENPFKNANAR